MRKFADALCCCHYPHQNHYRLLSKNHINRILFLETIRIEFLWCVKEMMNQTQVMKPSSEVRAEIYAPIHKAHRYVLFKIASEAGKANYKDKQNISSILSHLTDLTNNIKLHAAWEEKAVHPLLAKKIPGAKEKIEAEHKTIHANLELLMSYLGSVAELPSNDQNLGKLLQEFYLAFNRFLPMYLNHIDYEEEQVEPILWHLSTDQELNSTLASLGAIATPEQIRQNMELIISAVSLNDLSQIILAAKAASPQVLQFWLSAAQQNLSPEDYAKLKAQIET